MTAPTRGACAVCSRRDVPLRSHGRVVAFHYAPCGLACSGGEIGERVRCEEPGVHPNDCRCLRAEVTRSTA